MVTYRAKQGNFNVTVGTRIYYFNPFYETSDINEIKIFDELVASGDLERVKLVEEVVKKYVVATDTESNEEIETKAVEDKNRRELQLTAQELGFQGNVARATSEDLRAFIASKR